MGDPPRWHHTAGGAIRDGDEQMVESAVVSLSQSRRVFAPLAFVVGAFIMLFDGLKLLVTNWRLTVVQILPAMWIWLATADLKAHVFHGRGFHHLNGAVLVGAMVLVIAITATSFYLNAVFAFAIARPSAARHPTRLRPCPRACAIRPRIRRGGRNRTRDLHPRAQPMGNPVVRSGDRNHDRHHDLLLRRGARSSPRNQDDQLLAADKLAASAMGGTVGAVICTPPYVMGRVAILMLGSSLLFIPGLIFLTLAVTVQAGATGAVKALKMSAKIVAGDHSSRRVGTGDARGIARFGAHWRRGSRRGCPGPRGRHFNRRAAGRGSEAVRSGREVAPLRLRPTRTANAARHRCAGARGSVCSASSRSAWSRARPRRSKAR